MYSIAEWRTTYRERNEKKMNNDKLTIIMPSGINAELAPPPSRPSLRKRFKCLLSSLAMLVIGHVYADYTLTYQYNEPVVIKEFDRYGGEFDYTFEKKTYTAPTYSTYGGTLKTEYSFSRTTPPSWVKISRVDGVIYGTRTLNGVPSNYTFPKDGFSLEPHIIATVEENTTSAERVCIVTNTLSAKSYPSYIGMGSQTSTSYFHWYCVFKQAPGSSTVTVTLEANDGTPVQPYSNYEYVNGGRNFGFDNGGTYTVINTGYKQTKMQPPYGAVVSDEWRRYADSFIMPTTSRAGCVFDGWWTVSIFPEANNVRISNADNTPIDGVKPTAKVTTIKAHWLFEAPHNFMATRNLTDMILLSWEPVVETSETTYNIYRSQSENCPATPTFTTSATSYNDTSAVAGQEYNYWIVAERPNYYSVSHSLTNTVSGYREMQQIATPTISPTDGAIFFGTSETVSLECATQGASIHYTTDGTTPDADSALYVSPFSVSETTTIKAVAIKDGMRTSEIATATITKQLPLSLSDALDTDMTLSAYGSAEWIGVRDSAAKVGAGYAKNGVLGNRQSTSLSVIVSGKGAFSFWWRVSCEGYGEYDCDLATFSAPDSNVQELKRDGIMPEWEKITASFSTDGEHTLTWTYKKDKSDADGDDCLYLDGFSWMPAAPDPIIWTITFNLNGADAQDGTSPRSINDAAAIGELPTPTRAGYTFAGWWTEAEGGMEVTATTTVAADMTLFAHWTENLPPPPAYTETTPVPVRHDWLAKYSGILSAAGNDYEAAAMRPTGKKDGKGNALCVWHDYLAGTDPTNANSVFRAKVEFENGRPKVGWEPDLNEKGAKTERFYKVFGKKTLASNENWTRLADETAQKDYNFFKVTVNMEETPDTEEELKFGDGTGYETGGSGGNPGDTSGNDGSHTDDSGEGDSTSKVSWTIVDGELQAVDLNGETEVIIPGNVTSIGDYCFSDCIGLASVIMPNSVTNIGYCAFEDCNSLTNVTMSSNVANIYSHAFQRCSGLTTIAIPDSVTILGDGAFEDCSSLTNVTMSSNLTNIYSFAFQGCSGLTTIAIPDSVTSLGAWAFEGCNELTSVTIGNGLTCIEPITFADCIKLTTVTIPNSVTSIGFGAFQSCYGLTNVEIPNSVTNIGEYAFRNDSGLTRVTIPESVVSIGEDAFARCSKLNLALLPRSLEGRVPSSAFEDCASSLQIVFYDGSVADLPCVTFDANGGLVDIVSVTKPTGYPIGELPQPTRSGYAFIGWFTMPTGGNQVAETTTITSDLTLYAHWEECEFEMGGNLVWTHQSDGSWKSGAITHSQSSWIQKTVLGPGELTFKWRVSSEYNWDKLIFSIDDSEQINISGVQDWMSQSYMVTGNGTHTLRWTYVKDGSADRDADCGWITDVVWTPE